MRNNAGQSTDSLGTPTVDGFLTGSSHTYTKKGQHTSLKNKKSWSKNSVYIEPKCKSNFDSTDLILGTCQMRPMLKLE